MTGEEIYASPNLRAHLWQAAPRQRSQPLPGVFAASPATVAAYVVASAAADVIETLRTRRAAGPPCWVDGGTLRLLITSHRLVLFGLAADPVSLPYHSCQLRCTLDQIQVVGRDVPAVLLTGTAIALYALIAHVAAAQACYGPAGVHSALTSPAFAPLREYSSAVG